MNRFKRRWTIAAISIPCVFIALVWFDLQLDSRAIERRRAKAQQLETLAKSLEASHMSIVLSKFGSPAEVAVLRAFGNDTTNLDSDSLVVFVYDYTYASVPWRARQHVRITFRFNQRLRVVAAWVDQTFS
jgi:hypothetical protein